MASAGKAASMEPINEEELDESSLFPAVNPLDSAPEDDSEGDESSDDLDDPTSLYAPRRQGIDVAGTQRESAKSSTLDVSLEDSFNRDHDEDHMSMGGGGTGMRPRLFTETSQQQHHRTVSHSMPAHSSAIRMGSSVPIGIPLMARWNTRERESVGGTIAAAVGGRYHNSDEAYYAHEDDAKFTPPHELSQRNEQASMTGDGAPNASMKRDLLRHRNAVLRSTGFLETNTNFTFLPVAGSCSDGRGGASETMVAGSLPATRHMAAGMAGAYGSRAGALGPGAPPAMFGAETPSFDSRPRPRVAGASALSAALHSRQ